MAWTAPDVSWADGDVVSGATFDALMENIAWLKHRGLATATRTTATTLSSTSRATVHSSLELNSSEWTSARKVFGFYWDGVGGGGVAVVEWSVYVNTSFQFVLGNTRFAATNEDSGFHICFLDAISASDTLVIRYDNTSAANNPVLNRMTTFALELGVP